jgi:hypothetical protein
MLPLPPRRGLPGPPHPTKEGVPRALPTLAVAIACGSAVLQGPIVEFNRRRLVELRTELEGTLQKNAWRRLYGCATFQIRNGFGSGTPKFNCVCESQTRFLSLSKLDVNALSRTTWTNTPSPLLYVDCNHQARLRAALIMPTTLSFWAS